MYTESSDFKWWYAVLVGVGVLAIIGVIVALFGYLGLLSTPKAPISAFQLGAKPWPSRPEQVDMYRHSPGMPLNYHQTASFLPARGGVRGLSPIPIAGSYSGLPLHVYKPLSANHRGQTVPSFYSSWLAVKLVLKCHLFCNLLSTSVGRIQYFSLGLFQSFNQSINQSIKECIYMAPLKQSSQRRLLRVGTFKKPWLQATFETPSANVTVTQFRRKVVPHSRCRRTETALTETCSRPTWTWDDHVY